VQGCFWHQHDGCIDSRIPKTRQTYWRPKLTGNQERDRKNLKLLRALGWKVLVVWDCQTVNADRLSTRLQRFLGTE
jgi:DNA mismatch endonuclease (patch repair protein)